MRKAPWNASAVFLIGACLIGVCLLSACDKWTVNIASQLAPSGTLERNVSIYYIGGSNKPAPGDHFKKFRLPDDAIRAAEAEPGVAPNSVRYSRSYRSADDGASDFRLVGNQGRRDPMNTLRWARLDCVLFERFVFEEQLKDSVDENSRPEAALHLHGLLRDIVVSAADKEAGAVYDITPLRTYLNTAGKHLVLDCSRLLYADRGKLKDLLAARLRTEGIALPADLDDDDAITKAFTDFTIGKLEALIVPKVEGGRAFDARSYFEPIGTGPDGDDLRIEGVLAQAMQRLHGSRENAEKALEKALYGLEGDLDGSAISFRFTLGLPGTLLRTNGLLDPHNRARVMWRFDAGAAARGGKNMKAESIVMRPERIGVIPGNHGVLELEQILAVMRALDELTAEQRAALGAAVMQLSDNAVEQVKAGLPEALQEVFAELVGIVARKH